MTILVFDNVMYEGTKLSDINA